MVRRQRSQTALPRKSRGQAGVQNWACGTLCCAVLFCAVLRCAALRPQMTVPEGMVWLRSTTTMPLRMK
jgi:hypothetical protein